MTGSETPAVVAAGRLTAEQYAALASRINPNRVREHDDGTPWIEGTDVRRWLTRIFGYGGWGTETLSAVVHGAEQVPDEERDGRLVWEVTRETTVRLILKTPAGAELTRFDGTAAYTARDASLGQAHNDATNTAETLAVKRAAANLGDVFGLGLRAGVLIHAYVGGALARPDGTPDPVWYVRDEATAADPEPDCVPSDNDDAPPPQRRLTAAEGARRVAAATQSTVVLRPIGDLTSDLQAAIARARKARDDAELVPVPS